MKVLVIGGTQFIGRLLVEELVKAGQDVTILHRKPKHDFGRRVENIMADRNDAEAMKDVLATRRFEVVFDNAYDFERGTTAAQVEATVRACANDRLSRYIFMSSVAAYGDGLNHKESDPLAPDYHSDPYVRHKATTERLLFRMHSQSGLPVVTFRPPFVYGPNTNYYREQFFWDRLRAGRPIIIPGDGHRLMQFAFVSDVAQAMVRSMTEPRAEGEAFNIGDTKPLTQVEVVEKLARVANTEATLVRVPRDVIQQAGGNAMNEPYYFGEYFDLPPITMNIGKVTRVLKMKLTPFEVGLKDTYRWYTRNHKPRTAGFEFDDKVLSSVKASSPASV
jgi:nucleoside-diphosphate-sugar epimerase